MLLNFVENYKKKVPECARFLSGFNPILNPRHKIFFIKIIYYCAYLRVISTQPTNSSSTRHVAKKANTEANQGGKFSFASLFGAAVLLFRAFEEQDQSMIAEFRDSYPKELLHEKRQGRPFFRMYKMTASVMANTCVIVSPGYPKQVTWSSLRFSNLDCNAYFQELLQLWRTGRNRNYKEYLNTALLDVIKKSGVTIEEMVPHLVQGLLHTYN